MKQLRILALLAGLAVATLSPLAGAQVKGYHFVYTVSDRLVPGAPTQVFHDGKRTYFQFARDVQTPTIFVSTPGGEQLANPVTESPYVVVQGVHDRFAVVSERGVRIDVNSVRPMAGIQATPAHSSREALTMNGGQAAPLEVGGRAPEPVTSVNVHRPAMQAPSVAVSVPMNASVTAPVAAPAAAPVHVIQPVAQQAIVQPVYPASVSPAASHTAINPAKHTVPVGDVRVPMASTRSTLARAPLARAGHVETIGVMPKQPGLRARGTGSLREAVERIVPSNFAGFEVGGVDVEQQVNWAGNGRPWINVLREVLAQAKVNAVVTFDLREVTLHRVSPSASQLAQLRTPAHPAGVPQLPVIAVPPAAPEWTLLPETDKTLSRALERWVERAGWQLAWDAQIDYPLDLRASFTGSFEEAISKVATSLAAAERPLHFTFFDGNKVLRVSGTTPATPYAAK